VSDGLNRQTASRPAVAGVHTALRFDEQRVPGGPRVGEDDRAWGRDARDDDRAARNSSSDSRRR
jgi:hypothetical protein